MIEESNMISLKYPSTQLQSDVINSIISLMGKWKETDDFGSYHHFQDNIDAINSVSGIDAMKRKELSASVEKLFLAIRNLSYYG